LGVVVGRNPKDSPHPAEYVLFLGCTVPVRAVNYELSARRVAERLGICLADIPEFSCCGYPTKSVNHYAYLLMAARNLALAEEKGLPICTLCSACCGALAEANHEIREDTNLRKRLNDDLSKLLGKRYDGDVHVTHFMRVLEREVGEKRIISEIRENLSGLHLAPHYGCHITKPTTIYGRVEDPENPRSLDRLIEMTGAHALSYENKLQCCGGGVLAMDEGVALSMAQSKLDHLRARQADAMVLACPFCNIMYESNQKKIEKVAQREYKLPVLFFPQLLGLALGIEPDDLGLKMNRIKTTELLKKINRRAD
jgi:heterodisulfide reductase subunit B